MAAAVIQGARTVPGAFTAVDAEITGDANYPTGGYPLTPASFGLNVLRKVVTCRPANVASAVNVPVPVLVMANGVISAFHLGIVQAGAELAAGTNVTASTFHLSVEGN